MTEHDIQGAIRLELSRRGYVTERINVGSGVLISDKDAAQIRSVLKAAGRSDLSEKLRHFETGAIKGRSDLDAIKDGRISFIEVKTATGRPSKDQLHFIERMKQIGCRSGIARSVEDAIKIVEGD